MIAHEADLRALMMASLEGDGVAHRTLLDRLSLRLRAYYKSRLARIGRSATEAEDLTQEALMAIHTQRHAYHPDEPLTPWVYAIARYKLIDHLRQTRSSMADVPIENAGEVLAREDHVSAESALDLDRLLGRLPSKVQHAIRCVKLDGLSVAEAAARLGMSESAIKINVHRGLKALAASIAQEKRT